MVYSGLGMAVGDRVEEKIGMKPTEEDRDKLEREMKRWTFSVRRAREGVIVGELGEEGKEGS